MCHSSRRPHRGQALVFLALVFIVLMGSLGLALDGGYNFGQRRAMQNAADAAALAGARELSRTSSVSTVNVLTTVRTVAQQNGVQDVNNPARLRCWYTRDDLSQISDCVDNSGLPTGATGVQVSVTEVHRTFVMSVLGAPTASTGATAIAQIQLVTGFIPGPITVCGMDTSKVPDPTRSTNGTPEGILVGRNEIFPIVSGSTDNTRQDGMSQCGLNKNQTCERVQDDPPGSNSGKPLINDQAYYYNADNANFLTPISYSGKTGPTFIMVAPSPNDLALCNIGSANFKGLNEFTDAIKFPPENGNWSPEYVNTTRFNNGNNAVTVTNTGGVNGCLAGQDITVVNGCVAMLPIIDSSGQGGPGNTTVAVRTVAAVYIMNNVAGQPNKTLGRLVKNYNPAGPGSTGWTAASSAPRTIRLVK